MSDGIFLFKQSAVQTIDDADHTCTVHVGWGWIKHQGAPLCVQVLLHITEAQTCIVHLQLLGGANKVHATVSLYMFCGGLDCDEPSKGLNEAVGTHSLNHFNMVL